MRALDHGGPHSLFQLTKRFAKRRCFTPEETPIIRRQRILGDFMGDDWAKGCSLRAVGCTL